MKIESPRTGRLVDLSGIPVVETSLLPPWEMVLYDDPFRNAGTPPTLYVGKVWWLRYRLWLDDQRQQSRVAVEALCADARRRVLGDPLQRMT